MLVLTRKVGQRVVIAGNVHVTVVGMARNQVRLGIDAPKEVTVDRAEVYQRRKGAGAEGKEAATVQPTSEPTRAVSR